jgi:competence protein ComFC
MLSLLQRCTICHTSGQILCPNCQRHLHMYDDTTSDLDGCLHLQWVVIGRHYDRIIKHLIHRLKYGKGKAIAKLLWSKLATLIHTTALIDQIYAHPWQVIVTAVPTHWIKRYITRWYNQAELLAQSIAHSLDLPYSSLLTKSRRTTSQVKIHNRSDRLTNIINSFTTSQGFQDTPLIKGGARGGGIIILVDDIITTWATISECARIIHDQYPHSQIWWVCIARNR